MGISAGRFDRQIRIEQPIADNSFIGAGSGSWGPVDEAAWAAVEDTLGPTRVRLRFREDVTASMRFVIGTRILQITAGPREIGRREAVEFLAEEYRPAGNPA
jgi:head-tail adaptor